MQLRELDCKGKGTEEDLFIIDESVALPNSFEINESEVFIHIINHRISKLNIAYSFWKYLFIVGILKILYYPRGILHLSLLLILLT